MCDTVKPQPGGTMRNEAWQTRRARELRQSCIQTANRANAEDNAWLAWCASYGGPRGAINHFGGYLKARAAYEAQ